MLCLSLVASPLPSHLLLSLLSGTNLMFHCVSPMPHSTLPLPPFTPTAPREIDRTRYVGWPSFYYNFHFINMQVGLILFEERII